MQREREREKERKIIFGAKKNKYKKYVYNTKTTKSATEREWNCRRN